MSKAKKTARKTPRHVAMLIEMRRKLIDGSGNVRASTQIFEAIFHIGFEIEKALKLCGVKTLVNKNGTVMTQEMWTFGGGVDTTDKSEERRDRATRNLREALQRLGDLRDTGRILFGKLDAGALDHNALGGLVEAAADKIGRDIEGMFPDFGLELKKDQRLFLEV